MRLENVEDLYPLTPLQEGLLFHSLAEPHSHVYFNQMLATLGGNLDESAFKAAWQGTVERHAILRTFFVWNEVKAPVQVVERTVDLPYEKQDLRGLSGAEQEQRLLSAQTEDLERGFELAQAPLMRLCLFQTADDRHEFLWSFHHILMDGWAMFHVLKEVFDSYTALCKGQSLEMEQRRPYRDYIAWLKRQDLARAESFWRQRLAGFTAPTELVGCKDDKNKSLAGTYEFDTHLIRFSQKETSDLQAFCRKQRITLSTLVQGAWALLLSRYTGDDDVLFGTVVSGRPASLAGVESMVGLFINTLPVRARIDEQRAVKHWLNQLQGEQAEVLEYEYSPLIDIQQWSDVARGTSLFDSILMFENYHKESPLEEMGGALQISNVRWFERVNYPLVALVEPAEALQLRIVSHHNRFETGSVERMLGHWRILLEAMVAAPEQPLSDLPLLTKAEKQHLLVELNEASNDYPREQCINVLFEEQVKATPDAIALVFNDQEMTYGELNAQANQIAHFLQDKGVGLETKVGICVERSFEMIAGILGILKAGGVYVPLDPHYPIDRIAFMLEDTGITILLTLQKLLDKLPQGTPRVVCLDSDWQEIQAARVENLPVETKAENIAYVMYTSGSTGMPKGVSIPHRGVVRLVRNTNYVKLGRDEVFLQLAPISFDASTFEIWGSLLNGAKLVIFQAARPSLDELVQSIDRLGITTLWLTAGLFHEMMERHPDGLTSVRQLLAGGDVLSVAHVKNAAKQADRRIINGYGPTENTTFACCYRVQPDGNIDSSVPIGRPVANTTVYILDRSMRPVPVGISGELYIGGDGLARDYLNRPKLTAERFVPNPFSRLPGARLYRTGDRVRYRNDDNIEFLGRDDNQVKIRGYRIELGEIQAHLGGHPAIEDTVVVVREDSPGDKTLVAYTTSTNSPVPTTTELRRFLSELLPDYMVPSAFVAMVSFPLTPNDKVDRDALPTPDGVRPDLLVEFVAPTSSVELAISTAWREVLNLEKVGLHDNFFELGGHSLHLMQVHNKLNDKFAKALKMVDLFRFPTVAALAEFVERADNESSALRESQSRAQQRRASTRRRRQIN